MQRFFILFFIFLIKNSQQSVQCLDNSGKPVDWYIFYKLPHLWDHPESVPISNGTGFLYMDPNQKTWKLMENGMDAQQNNAVYSTLEQYYGNSDNSSYFSYMYNDEWPDSTIWSNNSGHAKGVVMFDKSSGFWLIHSIPKFPSVVEFRYPSNAHWYGQMGLCLSLGFNSLADVAQQLFFYNTFTYQFNLPDYFANSVPLLTRLQKGDYQQSPPYTNSKIFKTLGGQSFRHFAKTGSWGKDLYSDYVMGELRTSIKVETWDHESGTETNLPSVCSQNAHMSTLNAAYIRLPFNINYKTYEDHSKFVVAFSDQNRLPAVPYVCIGDINRQSHQLHRGGGTMCIYEQDIYQQYANIISETVPCNNN
ncbi:unnamed protein product [Caenorhabditis angaria]|uniref:Uncharacterized protein n=1 Tax=Caenorhabditis angaria TaxID=860376 RepID=A0A9P1IJ83_9PELO|nr:unnamed protein product [Caenorhabditis angaria]